MRPKKDIFIASPLFNGFQHQVIDRIEKLCGQKHLQFYSARKDSEPYIPHGEAKKDPDAWQPVFTNNEEGLEECTMMISVLNYYLPENESICSVLWSAPQDDEGRRNIVDVRPVELPDSGTVWEMGYFRALNKIVVGFHPEKRGDHLNLMLTHGCDALVSGWDNLEKFFGQPGVPNVTETIARRNPLIMQCYDLSMRFDWSATERWGAQNEPS